MLCDWCLWYIFFLCKYMVLWQNPCWEEDSQPEWLLCYSQCRSNIFSKPSNYSFGKKWWESSNLAVLLSSISMNLSKYLSLILRKDWCQSLSWQRKCCYLHLLWWAFPFFFNVKTRINLGLVEPFVLMCKIWAFRTNWNWLDVISTVND